MTVVDSSHMWIHGGVPDILSRMGITCNSWSLFVLLHLGREVGWSSRVGLAAVLTSQGLEITVERGGEP